MSFSRFSRDLLAARGAHQAALAVVRSITSTQDLARRVVRDLAEEGSLPADLDVVAWQQTRGRGRGGRDWVSAPGQGIWATVIRVVPTSDLQLLPVRAVSAVAEVLRGPLGSTCGIKWPNDLVVDGQKLGGVLVDATTGGDGKSTVAVGFGVNVFDAPLDIATSVWREGADVSLVDLTLRLLEAVAAAVRRSDDDELERFCDLLVHQPGARLRCRVSEEEEWVEGEFLQIDPTGCLRLRVEGEERVFSVAEVQSHV